MSNQRAPCLGAQSREHLLQHTSKSQPSYGQGMARCGLRPALRALWAGNSRRARMAAQLVQGPGFGCARSQRYAQQPPAHDPLGAGLLAQGANLRLNLRRLHPKPLPGVLRGQSRWRSLQRLAALHPGIQAPIGSQHPPRHLLQLPRLAPRCLCGRAWICDSEGPPLPQSRAQPHLLRSARCTAQGPS